MRRGRRVTSKRADAGAPARGLAWRVLQRAQINKPSAAIASWAVTQVMHEPGGDALVGAAFASFDAAAQLGVVESLRTAIDRPDHPFRRGPALRASCLEAGGAAARARRADAARPGEAGRGDGARAVGARGAAVRDPDEARRATRGRLGGRSGLGQAVQSVREGELRAATARRGAGGARRARDDREQAAPSRDPGA